MSFNATELLLWMAIVLFSLGGILILAGSFILLLHTRNKDVHTLAVQTNRLAQKGILDDVAGLVGNASTLLDATNQLVRTTTGIGVFMVIVGFILTATSIYILTQLF
ncbi:MAG: hypothetical protein ACK2U1_17700 [Anaerolineales bacterium]|jgi:hypothetical protein